MILRCILLLTLGFGLSGGSPWVESTGARLRLLAGARDGATHWAAIEIALDPGWKTYWRMPGDSGIPPRIDWSRSRNVSALEVLWPAPVRFKDAAGVSIGYKGAVVFPLRITAKDPNAPVVLDLSVQYGVCKHLCAPAEGQGSLILFADGADERAVAEARARVPKEIVGLAPDGFGILSTKIEGDTLLIEVGAAGGDLAVLDLFAEGPPATVLSPPKRVGVENGRAIFRLRLDTLEPDERGELAFTVTTPDRAIMQRWRVPTHASK